MFGGVLTRYGQGGRDLKKKKKTNSAPLVKKEQEDIHASAEGIPESIANDICEAIDDAREKEEKRPESIAEKYNLFNVRRIIGIIAFAIVLYWGLEHISLIFSFFGKAADVLSPLIIGGGIAFVLNMLLVPFEKLWNFTLGRFGGKKADIIKKFKRPVCLVLSTVVMFGIVVGVFFIAIPELTMTVKLFIDMIPDIAAGAEELFGKFSEFVSKYGVEIPEYSFDTAKAIEILESFLSSRGEQMLNSTVGFTTSLFSTLFNWVLSFVFAFYVLAQKEKLGRKTKTILYAVTKKERADTIIDIAVLSNSTFNKFVTGQVTEAAIIGILCYIGMSIFGMPHSMVISVVTGVTALIPMFGAFIGAATGAVLILSVDFMQAVWFLIFIVVLQQIETNLIYPRVVGKSIGLPGILVLTAVTVGGAVFGFAGILLGVPVCSVIYCIFNAFVEKRFADKSAE